MTFKYTFMSGPNHGKEFLSELKVLSMSVDGGRYVAGADVHIEDKAAEGPHIDEDIKLLEWEPEN